MGKTLKGNPHQAGERMEKEVYAYMAGIIDGEGSVIIEYNDNQRTRPSFYTRVTVAQKDKRLLLWVQKHFGGKIFDASNRTYQWQAPVSGIKELLINCLPYLIIKRRKAIMLIALRESIEAHKLDRYKLDTKGLCDLSEEVYKYRKELYDRFMEDDPKAILSPFAGATTERIDSLQRVRNEAQKALYHEMRQSDLNQTLKIENTAEMSVLV